jgi:hypothetical protein
VNPRLNRNKLGWGRLAAEFTSVEAWIFQDLAVVGLASRSPAKIVDRAKSTLAEG